MFGLPSQSKSRERAEASPERRTRVFPKTKRKSLAGRKTLKIEIETLVTEAMVAKLLRGRAILQVKNVPDSRVAIAHAMIKLGVIAPEVKNLLVRKAGEVMAKKVNAAAKRPRAMVIRNPQENQAGNHVLTAKLKIKRPMRSNTAANQSAAVVPTGIINLIIQRAQNHHSVTVNGRIEMVQTRRAANPPTEKGPRSDPQTLNPAH